LRQEQFALNTQKRVVFMTVFIANLGRQNYLWPVCLEQSSIATYEDEALRPLWLANDRAGYIAHCIAHSRTAIGQTPTKQLASRWFNIGVIISNTSGDLWIHREKDEVWWTISLPGEPEATLTPAHPGSTRSVNVYQIHKPCTGWDNKDKKGRTLTWKSLHPKAREFLFTEGTLQQLSSDNAKYAEALVDGTDLSAWHSQPEWKSLVGPKKGGVVTVFTSRQRAALRMATTALETTKNSNGQEVVSVAKNKEFGFANVAELQEFLETLIDDQEGLCALTGLKLQMDGTHSDPELLCSLDRIDSDGHYEKGNLQIVCRFANRWKGAGQNNEFVRLLEMLRT
jgi:hypothetical protein